MTQTNTNTITTGKYVELTYLVQDTKTQDVLTEASTPLAYVHGVNEILAPTVTRALEGKAPGDRVDAPVDCTEIYGPRDESLVITESLEGVPDEYRKVGTAILMENDLGQTKSFFVTKLDADTITLDGNNPLCGKQVVFQVQILTVRDATAEEMQHGGTSETDREQ